MPCSIGGSPRPAGSPPRRCFGLVPGAKWGKGSGRRPASESGREIEFFIAEPGAAARDPALGNYWTCLDVAFLQDGHLFNYVPAAKVSPHRRDYDPDNPPSVRSEILNANRRYRVMLPRGYLGHEISNGDPLVTAAGAAGGVVISETLHYAAKKQAEKAFATGYDKGKSDAVKQQYWLYVSMQKQRNQVSSVRLSRATAGAAD